MSCTNPLYGLKLHAINPKTGKERIKILPRRNGDDYFSLCQEHGKDSIVILPCGHCSSCIEARSKTWALRCCLEAIYHDQNCFVTLTYNDKCLPNGLCKDDLKKFLRRLRRACPGVRYYACGEYGETTHRPHYHLVLFGYFPSDAKFETEAKFGGNFYSSKKLQSLWPFGFVSIGELSFASCAYVARYCQKKLGSSSGEFCLMSRHPGIGEQFFRDNYLDIYEYDQVIGDFGSIKSMSPGRYFDKLFEKIDPNRFEFVKNERINRSNIRDLSAMVQLGLSYYEQLLKHRASIKDDKFARLKRKEV